MSQILEALGGVALVALSALLNRRTPSPAPPTRAPALDGWTRMAGGRPPAGPDAPTLGRGRRLTGRGRASGPTNFPSP